MLKMGVFNKTSTSMQNRRYRLFSVVEHIGKHAHRGHYVCFSLDSNNQWMKFDDTKVSVKEYSYITNNAQAYMLFYELIHED